MLIEDLLRLNVPPPLGFERLTPFEPDEPLVLSVIPDVVRSDNIHKHNRPDKHDGYPYGATIRNLLTEDRVGSVEIGSRSARISLEPCVFKTSVTPDGCY